MKDTPSANILAEEHYLMDGNTLLAVTDGSGNVEHWNIYGNSLEGRLESGASPYYYVYDHLGSVRQVVDAQTDYIIQGYDYYPFGLIQYSSMAAGTTKETFTGKELDEETGLYYFGARYYDAALGRWSVPDPAGQFHTPYAYANNPVSYVDPNGEFAFGLIAASLLGGYAGFSAYKNYQSSGGDLVYTSARTVIETSRAAMFVAAGQAVSAGSAAAGATSVGQKTAAISTNAALEAGHAYQSGGDPAKAALVGAVTGYVGTTGFENYVRDQGLLSKLGYQAVGTTTTSIGRNWVHDRPLFSQVTVGTGPVNVTFKNGKPKYLFKDNIGNIAVHGLGFGNLLFGGGIKFHSGDLAFEFKGGLIPKVQDLLGTGEGWTGAYAILGDSYTTSDHTAHELSHVWQSRYFNESFLPIWLIMGTHSKIHGFHFNDTRSLHKTLNYWELQASGM